MVIAMLTLPAGTAGYFSRSLAGMMLLSCGFSALFSAGGLALGWTFDLPVGATTVLLAGTVFLAAGAAKQVAGSR
jgi:zinc transport system permease protein